MATYGSDPLVLKKESGQTVVEYILLLAVVVSLVFTFLRSEMFNRYFGNQGSFGAVIKRNNEFSYRHAYGNGTNDIPRDNRDGSNHPSYFDAERGGGTRFFSGKDPYP